MRNVYSPQFEMDGALPVVTAITLACSAKGQAANAWPLLIETSPLTLSTVSIFCTTETVRFGSI
ncbi:MAG: hypothetical protein ACD_81C00079G0001 [uncultured bacterium]|nr:MAG: hypothetical protein ACD_81C00079G0001 [uncultured bacterium]